MMQSALHEMWPQYLAGVLVLATGGAAAAAARAVRRHRSTARDLRNPERPEERR